MKSIVLIGALVALVSFVAADVSEVDGTAATPIQQTQTASEAPVQKVHVLNPGEKEYLSPNLIGLQNIAISNIPVTMDFINIIDAFREVVDGVRYEIVLNAVNTTDNNTEIVCRLVVLEKPWLTTLWGDKVRLLQESNCTSEELLDAHRDRKSIEEKYETNAIFTGTRNELTADDISKLESQILTSSNPQMKRTRTTTTAATPTSTTTTESVESEVVTEPTNPSSVVETQPEADDSSVSESNEEAVVVSTETTPQTTTSTEKVPELSDDEKKWLDDFLSIGAYNFETSLQNRRADGVNSEAQAGDQEAGKRAKRGLAGGVRQLDAQELKLASESLSQSLEKIAAGDGPKYTVAEVFSGTTQVVSGSLTKLEVDLNEDGQASPVRCLVSIWAQPWLKKDGYEVSFDCKDKPKTSHRHSRSVDEPKEKHSKHHEEHMRHIEYSQKKSHKKNHSLDKTEHLFSKFQRKFKKTYHTSMERQMRLRIFKHNLKLIQDLNKNEMGSAKYGITEFADMTTTEYRERTGLLAREESNSLRSEAKIPDVELPKEFDWREKGVVSPVKNQGNCGSCWAFSVTGNIEGLHAVKTGKLEEYSEQELLDCDTIDSACQGGLPDNAYQAIEKIGGLELESEYPYEGKKGKCHFDNSLTRVKVSGAVDLPKNETAMAQWLIANGPISIGINANAMQFYRGGVSHPWKVLCSKGNLDHGVLIVGYGVSDYPMFKKTLPYWIIKNSWGPKWGEQGYYRVYRGDNTCGVSEMATSAILA